MATSVLLQIDRQEDALALVNAAWTSSQGVIDPEKVVDSLYRLILNWCLDRDELYSTRNVFSSMVDRQLRLPQTCVDRYLQAVVEKGHVADALGWVEQCTGRYSTSLSNPLMIWTKLIQVCAERFKISDNYLILIMIIISLLGTS